MEDRIGNPNKPRRERWIHFMTHNASKNCIDILTKCFEDNLEQYTPEALVSQISQIYSSFSSLIHNHDTYRVGIRNFFNYNSSKYYRLARMHLKANQIPRFYSSLSSLIHNYNTYRVSVSIFAIVIFDNDFPSDVI